MSDSEKPKSWRERKKRIKHKFEYGYVQINRICKPASDCLKACVCFDILERLGHLAIVVAVIFYFAESGSRQKAERYQAWQVINLAQGKTGSGGRKDALQDLHRDGVSLIGVDISKAHLPGLKLENADLSEANLSNAILYEANFSGANFRLAILCNTDLHDADLSDANLTHANLYKAHLTEADLSDANLWYADLSDTDLWYADLSGANLTSIKNWQRIERIKNANIDGVKNPPEGFRKWAIEHGAVCIEDEEEWKKLLKEKQ